MNKSTIAKAIAAICEQAALDDPTVDARKLANRIAADVLRSARGNPAVNVLADAEIYAEFAANRAHDKKYPPTAADYAWIDDLPEATPLPGDDAETVAIAFNQKVPAKQSPRRT